MLEILAKYEFINNVIQTKDYIAEIRTAFTVKKEADNALKFAAYTVQQAEIKGKEQTLKLSIPFNEEQCIEMNKNFLFENMPTITSHFVANVDAADNGEKWPNS